MNFLRNAIRRVPECKKLLLPTGIETRSLMHSATVTLPLRNESKSLLQSAASLANRFTCLTIQERSASSLMQMHRNGPHIKKRKATNPLGGKSQMKGVVLKTLIKKPKKPNSANRKCVLVRLTNGKEMVAYVPGIGHNLQEHNIVLTRVGRLQDCPGVKIKCIRGKHDLGHVIKTKK